MGSFREQPGGWHHCHWQWGEEEQRGGRHRSSLGWQPLGTPDGTAQSPMPGDFPRMGGELPAGLWLPGSSLGLEAGLSGPSVGQGPAEVMGSDGTRVGTSWASPPAAEEGTWGCLWHPAPCPARREGRHNRKQAGLSTGHAQGLQGMGVLGAVHPRDLGQSQVNAWPGVLHLPVLLWAPKARQFPKLLWHFGKCLLRMLGQLDAELLNSPGAKAVTQVSPH